MRQFFSSIFLQHPFQFYGRKRFFQIKGPRPIFLFLQRIIFHIAVQRSLSITLIFTHDSLWISINNSLNLPNSFMLLLLQLLLLLLLLLLQLLRNFNRFIRQLLSFFGPVLFLSLNTFRVRLLLNSACYSIFQNMYAT